MELAFTASTNDDTKTISVLSTDNVHEAIVKEFGKAVYTIVEVRFGDEYVESGWNVEESGIDDGARLEVSFRKATVKEVVDDIVCLNPHLKPEKLMKVVNPEDASSVWWEVKIDPDDASRMLGNVTWSGLGIRALPESIGDLTVEGTLRLSNNNLATFPKSFGRLTVGDGVLLAWNNFPSCQLRQIHSESVIWPPPNLVAMQKKYLGDLK